MKQETAASIYEQQNPISSGRQKLITGTGVPNDLSPLLELAGQTLPINSTLLFELPTEGDSSVDVTLAFSAVGASPPVCSLSKTLRDKSEKMGATGARAAVAFPA